MQVMAAVHMCLYVCVYTHVYIMCMDKCMCMDTCIHTHTWSDIETTRICDILHVSMYMHNTTYIRTCRGVGMWDTSPKAQINGQECFRTLWVDNETIVCTTGQNTRVAMENPEVCVCVCVCMCFYIHVLFVVMIHVQRWRIYVCMHLCTYVHLYKFMHIICMCVCMCTHIHTCKHPRSK
jgi:hypothetical protein